MSLRVWLPLNGDLHNQGLEDIKITDNHGVTVDANGKIGQCYSFDGINDYLSITNLNLNSLPSVSFSFWCYPITDIQGLFLVRGTSAAHRVIIGNDGFTFRDSKNSTLRTTPFNQTIPQSTWTHIAIVYNHGEVYIYINGELDNYNNTYYNASGVLNSDLTEIRIGRRQASSYDYYYNGKLNDFRIYDHALSAAEVHEIAQGLVLHYPLDKKSLRPIGTNLVTGVTKGGRTAVLTDGRIGVQTAGENSDTYFTVNLSESITSGTTYYLSCDASGISDGQYWGFPLGAQNNSSMPSKFYNGHNEYIFTANDIDWGTNRLFLDDNYRNDWANPATFYNFVLIKNPTFEEIDNSGYGHNGWAIDTEITSTTPRYESAIVCNGANPSSNTLTGAEYFFGNLPMSASSAITVAWWGKNDTYSRGGILEVTASTFTATTGMVPQDYTTTAIANWDQTFRIYNGSSSVNIYPSFVKDGNWHHHAIVFDGANVYYYCDGIVETSGALTGTLPAFNGIRVGLGRAGNIYRQIKQSVSDLRIYCTPLLDTDIKSLYNIGMRIDNFGEVHTYELVESDAEHITKSGQLVTRGLEEIDENKARLTNGDGWQSSEFIEI